MKYGNIADRVAAATTAVATKPDSAQSRVDALTQAPASDIPSEARQVAVQPTPHNVKVGDLVELQIPELKENPMNPRFIYAASDISAFAATLGTQGQKVPIRVFVRDGSFFIEDGLRRVKSLTLRGLRAVKAEIIEDPKDDKALYLSARSVNTERKGQSPLDDALAWTHLMELGVFRTQADIVEAIQSVEANSTITQPRVSQILQLADMPKVLQEECVSQEINDLRFLYALKKYCDKKGLAAASALLVEAKTESLSARDLEKRLKTAEAGPVLRPHAAKTKVQYAGVAGELREFEQEGRVEFAITGLPAEGREALMKALKKILNKSGD